jgi:hypothetical protein
MFNVIPSLSMLGVWTSVGWFFFLFSHNLLGALFFNFLITQGLNIIFENLDLLVINFTIKVISLIINLLDYFLGNDH